MRAAASAISIVAAAIAVVSVFPPGAIAIWNRTESAPRGIYLITKSEVKIGDWAALSGASGTARWTAANGYLGTDWPVIKRIAALEGDEICRDGLEILINRNLVAIALERDGGGRKMPRWEGCFTLQPDEVFLLNEHPRSLDGRYFGAEKKESLLGSVRLIIRTD
ncbi:S26 family signal peptidase [Hyphococcus sp.]|uniref:S26 family signal peptidase n=1 Tax=Hyphococcus sp. TaxID=2038636 RepID=UPI002081E2A5|nr:MAG: hypothetical protein DHS20C04_01540 [Marinicaulis sp.]